jgi:predicted SnoaL-like aldol condensation-catalyzing enzyme
MQSGPLTGAAVDRSGRLAEVIAGDLDNSELLVDYFLSVWEPPQSRKVLPAMIGTASTNGARHEELRVFGFTLPGDGQAYTVKHVHIYRVAHGKIREHWAVRDDLSMLRRSARSRS